jgi:UDP-N-acetylmuramoyl-L-alanyl-D-glutamate--2,6-diaminopimelate ligase
MTVHDLFAGHASFDPAAAPVEVTGLEYDSRRLRAGDLFFAFPGEHADGHQFIPAALKAGVAAVVSERPAPADFGARWIQVPHGRRALARAALSFYGRPDRRLILIGVTGTNGKTTTVFLMDSVLEAAGFLTARFGTVEHKVGRRRIPAINTTPESLDLVRMLDELCKQGGSHATFEVSSHALALGRVHGFDFHTAVFTNLSLDHLDFHKDMEEYGRHKRALLEGAGGRTPSFAVVNYDDAAGREWLASLDSPVLSYGADAGADVRAHDIDVRLDGMSFDVSTPNGAIGVRSALSGAFNVSNVLAAIATGICLNIELETIAAGIAACHAVPGRFERIDEGQPFVVILDYAHTDAALRNLIESARALLARSGDPGKIITMFGCGGDRDRGKRPLMGEIAARLSDHVILTSDNPRSEDPLDIINDILVGLRRVDVEHDSEPDREKAISLALSTASSGDIVLLAGKGHERRQTIGERSIEFDDREVARRVLHQLGHGGSSAVH